MAEKNRIFGVPMAVGFPTIDDNLPELTLEDIESKCEECLGVGCLVKDGFIYHCHECHGTGIGRDCDLGI